MAASETDRENPGVAAATVFIVDDDPDVRHSVSILVRSVGLADKPYASVQEFLAEYHPEEPGCLVLDVRMKGMSGLELQRDWTATFPLPPIIFITAHAEVSLATQALRAGAVDFFQKPYSPQTLLERIREAIELDRQQRIKRATAAEVQQWTSQLTHRQREIMVFLAQGQTAKQIAQRLSISPKTVDNHRASILEKMNVDNPTQLAHLLAALD